MKKKICLIGTYNVLYTKMMIIEFQKSIIDFDLILINVPKAQYFNSFFERLVYKLFILIRELNKSHYKQIPRHKFFFWKILIKRYLFLRSNKYHQITNKYQRVSFDDLIQNIDCFYVNNINDVTTYNKLKNENYDIAVLCGTDIISKTILDQFNLFCLNAHPGPLPECRGGGCLQNTLNQGLHPAISIHIVSPSIDEGDILKVVILHLEKDDTINSVQTKLHVLRAIEMAKLIKYILNNGDDLIRIKNNGKLYYWKDCTVQVQQKAEKSLKKLLKKI